MQIAILLFTIFILFFILFFKMVRKGNKQESKDEKLGIWNLIFVVFVLTLIPVALTAGIVLVLLGSTNVINVIFSLDISTKQIVLLAIVLLIYLFTLDNIFEMVCELSIGKNMGSILLMVLVRYVQFLSDYVVHWFESDEWIYDGYWSRNHHCINGDCISFKRKGKY